jgi:hypothetical protein
MVRAIENDVPEILVSRYPLGPVLALATWFPGMGAWLTRVLGVNEFFRRAAVSDSADPPSK